MRSGPGKIGANDTAGGARRPNTPARPVRKTPLIYVVLSVTVYCATAWGLAFAGIGAGWHALFPNSSSYASGAAVASDAEPE